MPHTLCVGDGQRSQDLPCAEPSGKGNAATEVPASNPEGAEHPLRSFALAVYGAAGVPDASTYLQDRFLVDVNVVLLAAYVGAVRGGALGAGDVARAQARVGEWQRDVVGPLRAVRRRLKHGPPPAPNPATDELRARIKALELEAELTELDELAAFADGLEPSPGVGDAATRAVTAMSVVLGPGAGPTTDADGGRALAVIAHAAAQYVGAVA